MKVGFIKTLLLLILAGVSISLVVGNNGVLTQASGAVMENRRSAAKEEVAMAWASCESEYWTKWPSNTALERKDVFTQENLNHYLSGAGTIVGTFTYQEGENTLIYQSKDNNLQYTFTISGNGVVGEAGESDSTEVTPSTLTELGKYILGADGKGRLIDGDFSEENTYEVEEEVNLPISKPNSLNKIKTPEGNLGKYVKYKSKMWIVLSDDTNGVELISADG